MIPEHTILLGYRGSIAHGMYANPEQYENGIDDKDVLGVCLGPMDCYLGFNRFEQRETFLREWDVVVYEYRKMIRLLSQANPNVLSLLWLEPNHYIHRTPQGQQLIDHRHLFNSKRIYHAFTGYAHGQLKRMTHFGDQAFVTGYLGAKRKALVEKYGFDCKNAAHLIRLLRMGIEFLREERLHVLRPDAKQLMEIKQGYWTLEQVKAEAEHLFRRAEAAYDACTLPSEPNQEAINRLMRQTLHEHICRLQP
jgi:predicted nucleotidyltransferase